jgi:hypothetical protein
MCNFDQLFAGPISESSNGVSKLVCNSCMEMNEAQTSSQLQTAATCSKSIPPVAQPRYLVYLLCEHIRCTIVHSKNLR